MVRASIGADPNVNPNEIKVDRLSEESVASYYRTLVDGHTAHIYVAAHLIDDILTYYMAGSDTVDNARSNFSDIVSGVLPLR